MNPNEPVDELLACYLETPGAHPLSRAYRAAGTPQPPASVDAAVLAAAQQALRSPRRRSRAPFASHWTLSLAAAAVAAVALLAAVQIQRGGAPAPAKTEPAGQARDRLAPAAAQAPPQHKAGTRAPSAKPQLEKSRAAATPAPATQAYGRPAAKQGGDAAADPQTWLRRIRALAAAGHVEEARLQLMELRRRYPDYRIPPLPELAQPPQP